MEEWGGGGKGGEKRGRAECASKVSSSLSSLQPPVAACLCQRGMEEEEEDVSSLPPSLPVWLGGLRKRKEGRKEGETL